MSSAISMLMATVFSLSLDTKGVRRLTSNAFEFSGIISLNTEYISRRLKLEPEEINNWRQIVYYVSTDIETSSFYSLKKPSILYQVLDVDGNEITETTDMESSLILDKLRKRIFNDGNIIENFINQSGLEPIDVSLALFKTKINITGNEYPQTYVYSFCTRNIPSNNENLNKIIDYTEGFYNLYKIRDFSSVILCGAPINEYEIHSALLIIDHKHRQPNNDNRPMLFLMDSGIDIYQHKLETNSFPFIVANEAAFGNLANEIICLNQLDCYQSSWSCSFNMTSNLVILNKKSNIEEVIVFNQNNIPILRPTVFGEFFKELQKIEKSLISFYTLAYKVQNTFDIITFDDEEFINNRDAYIKSNNCYLIDPDVCDNYTNLLLKFLF